MRRLLVLAALLVPLRAHANTCNPTTFTTTLNPPLGCPIVVYKQSPFGTERVTATRGEMDIDLMASVEETQIYLDIDYRDYSCTGHLEDESVQETLFSRFEIALSDAQEGDEIQFGGVYVGVVQPTGTCTDVLEPLYCTTTNYGDPCPAPGGASDDVGCQATSGSSGAALVLVLAALLLVRRRR